MSRDTIYYVAFALDETNGPLPCSCCTEDSMLIWAEESEAEKDIETLLRYHGVARCKRCGPPGPTL